MGKKRDNREDIETKRLLVRKETFFLIFDSSTSQYKPIKRR